MVTPFVKPFIAPCRISVHVKDLLLDVPRFWTALFACVCVYVCVYVEMHTSVQDSSKARSSSHATMLPYIGWEWSISNNLYCTHPRRPFDSNGSRSHSSKRKKTVVIRSNRVTASASEQSARQACFTLTKDNSLGQSWSAAFAVPGDRS